MKIVVVGGSNSVRKSGWVDCLKEKLETDHPDVSELVNLSVGGSSSVMGAYRLFSSNAVAKGDVVFWEYALNDANFFQVGRCPLDLLLRHVEYIIRRCIQLGARFIPLIFSTMRQELGRKFDEYRAALRFLFDSYGIEYFDVSLEMRRAFNVRVLPRDLYDDGNHYALGGEVVAKIGAAASELIKRVDPIDGSKHFPLFVKPGQRFRVITDLDGVDVSIFRNSLLNLRIMEPQSDGAIMRAAARPCTVTGLAVLTTSKGGVFEVCTNETCYNFSLVQDERSFQKPVLKVIHFEAVLDKPMEIAREESLTVHWGTEKSSPILADLGYSESPSEREIKMREARIVGIIVEEC